MAFSRNIILLLAFVCSSSLYGQQKDSLLNIVINKDSLSSVLQILASDSFGGRLAGSAGGKLAGEFIAAQFYFAGLKPLPGLKGYFEEIPRQGSNVVAVLEGRSLKNEIIIFSAHYDHIGRRGDHKPAYRPTELEQTNDSVYNGANDNASGVSAVIMLARYFASLQTNERTLLFIAFTGEESGLLGSRQFAENIDGSTVKAVINLEMLGRGKQPFVTGAERTNLVQLLNQQLYQIDPKKFRRRYFKKDSDVVQRLFERSDNYPFAIKGIPAHTIMSTFATDHFYHSLHDEYRTLNLKSMLRIIHAIALSCDGLASGADSPSRIKLPFQP